MAVKDMTGQTCGKLFVIERDTSKKTAAAYWLCKCECGQIKSVRGQSLRDGSVVDCGCGLKNRRKNTIDTTSLINQRFGRLTVKERDLSKPYGHGKEPYWICQCDCGTMVSVRGPSLRQGKTKSCGCYKKDVNTDRCTLNLTGQQFGYLTAIEKINEQKHGSYIWKCLCQCGNIYYADASTLNLGQCTSCGCRTRSQGEESIEKLLKQANILFETEYSFQDCRNPKTKSLYRYDFAIKNNDGQIIRLIEFDGEQHFKESSFFKGSLEERKFNDVYKNNYAKHHNIPLVRIPYTILKTLTIDDLLGDKYKI